MTSTRDPAGSARAAPLTGRARAVARRPGVRRFSKYAVGSVVAFGASNLAFLLFYGTGLTSPKVATVLSFAAGIPVNYALNRRWAWQRRGRPTLRGELLPYAGVVTLSIVLTALGTEAADRWLQTADLARATEVLIVDLVFIAINGGLFLGKYVLLDRLVFTDGAGSRRTVSSARRPDAERVP